MKIGFPKGPPDYIIEEARRALRERFQDAIDEMRYQEGLRKTAAEKEIESELKELQKMLDEEIKGKGLGGGAADNAPAIARKIRDKRKELETEIEERNRLEEKARKLAEEERLKTRRQRKPKGSNNASKDDRWSSSEVLNAVAFAHRSDSRNGHLWGINPRVDMEMPSTEMIASGIGVGLGGLLSGLKTASIVGNN